MSRISRDAIGDPGANPEACRVCSGEVKLSNRVWRQVFCVGTQEDVEPQPLYFPASAAGITRAGFHHNTKFHHGEVSSPRTHCTAVHLYSFPLPRQCGRCSANVIADQRLLAVT